MEWLGLTKNTSGEAADTGSAVHAGCAEWHKEHDYDTALAALKESVGRYPKADIGKAGRHFQAYTKDPRNIEAKVEACEKKVKLRLAKDVFVFGTLDQIRLHPDGTLRVWDIKTGARLTGWEMIHEHAYQLAAYALAATDVIGRDVLPGGFIRTDSYLKRTPTQVFWPSGLSLSQCRMMMRDVLRKVFTIRNGVVPAAIPGTHCSFCPAGELLNCLCIKEKQYGDES